MDSLLYAKPLSIQQHSDDIREEVRTARLLCDQLRLARRLAGPADVERYDTLIRQAEQITAYLQSMADTVDMMSTYAYTVSWQRVRGRDSVTDKRKSAFFRKGKLHC